MIDAIQRYWNEHIHDLKMTRHAVGTREFFDDLDDYRFDKLHYLPRLVDFKNGYKDRTVLEVGCGIGIDLLRFAQGGARVTGIDLAQRPSISRARISSCTASPPTMAPPAAETIASSCRSATGKRCRSPTTASTSSTVTG